MKNQSALECIREWLGGIGWDLFLWSLGMNQEQYISAILRENIQREGKDVIHFDGHFYRAMSDEESAAHIWKE